MINFSFYLRRVPSRLRRLLAAVLVAFLLATGLVFAQSAPAPAPQPVPDETTDQVPIMDPCTWCTYWWCIGCEG